ncbi:hypothetical protein [Streptomyces neyagawaensis]|uniref:Secreted protein n=1 Tax=Streptomyces neyagawaensis TaxID=42238 RepID=A0ABV3AUP6_9ACTN
MAAVTTAGICAVMLAATQATAGTATLNRQLQLTDSPTMGASASVSRTIYLAADNYGWSVATSDNVAYVDSLGNRSIYLAAGTYNWTCTIYSPANGYYENYCSIKKAGSDPAYVESGRYTLPHSGTYNITSYLTGL